MTTRRPGSRGGNGPGSNQYQTKPAATTPARRTDTSISAEDVAAAFDPGSKPWRDAGFDADTSREWRAIGFTPRQATTWIQEGFEPSAAEEWSDRLFAAEDASGYRAAGFTSSEAYQWRADGFNSSPTGPFAAKPFFEAGVPSAEANRWHRNALTVEEHAQWTAVGITNPGFAAEWKEGNFTPEAAAVWVARGVNRPVDMDEADYQQHQDRIQRHGTASENRPNS